MIVVEGPDGSGKTTLLEKLIEDFNLELVPRAVNSDAEYLMGLDEWVEANASRDDGFICDRHQLISHLMYGPTMRRTLFGQFQHRGWLSHQIELFWSRRPIVICCLPPLENVKLNLEQDDHKVAQADIDVFYWNYHIWFSSNWPDRRYLLLWDYTSMLYPELAANISSLRNLKGHYA